MENQSESLHECRQCFNWQQQPNERGWTATKIDGVEHWFCPSCWRQRTRATPSPRPPVSDEGWPWTPRSEVPRGSCAGFSDDRIRELLRKAAGEDEGPPLDVRWDPSELWKARDGARERAFNALRGMGASILPILVEELRRWMRSGRIRDIPHHLLTTWGPDSRAAVVRVILEEFACLSVWHLEDTIGLLDAVDRGEWPITWDVSARLRRAAQEATFEERKRVASALKRIEGRLPEAGVAG